MSSENSVTCVSTATGTLTVERDVKDVIVTPLVPSTEAVTFQLDSAFASLVLPAENVTSVMPTTMVSQEKAAKLVTVIQMAQSTCNVMNTLGSVHAKRTSRDACVTGAWKINITSPLGALTALLVTTWFKMP
jgi:hypothetical protein